MTISELIKEIEVLRTVGDTSKEVTDIQFDSRRVGEGCLFVAQVGTAADGHAYIESCVAQGAVAVVLEKEEYIKDDGVCYILVKNSDEALGKMAHCWYGKPSQQLKLVGVTGTNGKTTTATLLYKLFKALGYKAGLLSTVVNYVDEEAVAATHTTPNALELNALLHKMVEAGCTHAFMEVSSHAIAQERIAGLEYAGALFTNLTRDHLDYHKTFDNYRDTKKILFDRLGKEAFAITNIDDRNGLVMTQNCRSRVLTYSTHTQHGRFSWKDFGRRVRRHAAARAKHFGCGEHGSVCATGRALQCEQLAADLWRCGGIGRGCNGSIACTERIATRERPI